LQVTEALRVLEPLLENQGNFPIRMKQGEKELGKLSKVVYAQEYTALGGKVSVIYFIPGEEAICIREVYQILSSHDCSIVGPNNKRIVNFANGLLDMGGAMYFGGCSIFLEA